ncbi:MAG: MBL fold metallo-hydrolase [Kiritimatiellae bacterium]|nr:MBL fold metallo-hydrolase [Kiritimatiellia bacterium]
MAELRAKGIIELVPGLYLLAGPGGCSRSIPNYRGCCVYLIRGTGDRYLMVDTGYAQYTDTLVQLLASLGITPSRISVIAGTHAHEDHLGGCAFFQGEGARLAIHEAAKSRTDAFLVRVRPDILLEDARSFEANDVEFQTYHTPGHTADSCCFLTTISGKRVLFAGDITGWFFPGQGSDYAQMVASVQKVRSLKVDLICGGHWLVDEDIPGYWEKRARSVGEGIYSLVDRFGSEQHRAATGQRLLGLGG